MLIKVLVTLSFNWAFQKIILWEKSGKKKIILCSCNLDLTIKKGLKKFKYSKADFDKTFLSDLKQGKMIFKFISISFRKGKQRSNSTDFLLLSLIQEKPNNVVYGIHFDQIFDNSTMLLYSYSHNTTNIFVSFLFRSILHQQIRPLRFTLAGFVWCRKAYKPTLN